MQKISKFTFQKGNDEYVLSLGWDDDALVEGDISFSISALKRDIESGEEFEPISASVSIVNAPDYDPEIGGEPIPYIRVVVENNTTGEKEIIHYSLQNLFEEFEIIDQIPAYIFGGDPITGCLIRSGISASIVQIISCKNNTAGIVPWFARRLRYLGKCLLHSIPDMSMSMIKKSFKCLRKFGF